MDNIEVTSFLDSLDKDLATITNELQIKEINRRKIDLIKSYEGSDRILSFEEIHEANKKKRRKGVVSTGYVELDKKLGGGFTEGNLVLITGFSGNGKTNFCFNLTKNMVDQNPLWLPYEETAEELSDKLIAWKQDAFHFYAPSEMRQESIEWIEKKIIEAKVKFGVRVVFIDNLHFLVMGETDNSKSFMKAANLAKSLKQIADKTKTCIVVIAHLRKSSHGMHFMPSYEDVSGSSDIVKVANKILCVWREAERDKDSGELTYTGITKVAIQKVREANGELGTVDFTWEKGIFTENTIQAKSFKRIKKINDDIF